MARRKLCAILGPCHLTSPATWCAVCFNAETQNIAKYRYIMLNTSGYIWFSLRMCFLNPMVRRPAEPKFLTSIFTCLAQLWHALNVQMPCDSFQPSTWIFTDLSATKCIMKLATVKGACSRSSLRILRILLTHTAVASALQRTLCTLENSYSVYTLTCSTCTDL
jgi:hypothetical protein